MSLAEFGWKLCATAAFCAVASYLAGVSMLFLPGWWGLGQPVAIVFVASPYLVVLGFFLAIIGHVLNWQRRA
jgi:hypothetical protein